MKKIVLGLLVLLVTSCKKEEIKPQVEPVEDYSITNTVPTTTTENTLQETVEKQDDKILSLEFYCGTSQVKIYINDTYVGNGFKKPMTRLGDKIKVTVPKGYLTLKLNGVKVAESNFKEYEYSLTYQR